MKISQEAMSWLTRYERAMARHLPLRGRGDIQKELHSHILDELEERFGEGEVHSDQMQDYLQDLGAPRLKAAAYRQEAYLVPPGLYPLFRMVAGIVMIVLAVVLLATQAFTLGSEGLSATGILKIFGELFGGLTSALGSLVVVFFILQRVLPREEWPGTDPLEDEIWKVKDLPEQEYPQRIKLGDPVAEIVFSLIAIILFTVFPGIIGIHNFGDAGRTFTPVLAPAFWALVPLLIFRWCLGTAFNVILIIQRRWTLPLRLTDISLRAFSLGIVALFLRTGFSSLVLTDQLTIAGLEGVVSVFRILFPILMILALVGSVAEIIKKVIALYREPHHQSDQEVIKP